MPKKKTNNQKAKARKLFEKEGLSLAEIAKKLDISPGTVRGWKSKDKKNNDEWNTFGGGTKKEKQAGTKKKRSSAPSVPGVPEARDKRLDNLIPIQPGEQRSIKHGMYSKQLNPWAKEIYDTLEDIDELAMLQEAIKIQFSNFVGGQKRLDFSESGLQASSRAGESLARMIKDYKLLRTKIGNVEEDDGFIDALMKSARELWSNDD